jgi:predicted CXXCH cytochrome family protein
MDEGDFPNLIDNTDLDSTTICNNCHTANGVALAKAYWDFPGSSSSTAGSWAVEEGEANFCGSCHDSSPGNTKRDGSGDTAYNAVGDGTLNEVKDGVKDNDYGDSSFGFYANGHGKSSGTYTRLSWQDTSATGNPAADKQCSGCHDFATAHFNSTVDRLKSGYENDSGNSNCKKCHDPGNDAVGNPQWYTTYNAFEGSAHFQSAGGFGTNKCTGCHDPHGAAGAFRAMALGKVKVDSPTDSSNFCYQCHKDPGSGGILNKAVSGTAYNNDIMEAFNESTKHDLGTSFTINGKTYSLQCSSCHNVHIVTGKYWDHDQSGKSPISRFTNNTEVWGDGSGEKMNDYATVASQAAWGYSGKYQKPGGTTHQFDGSQLADYPTFCLDCHQYQLLDEGGNTIKAKNWNSDKHGLKRAGYSGLGIHYSTAWGSYWCPSGYNICGRATGWGGSTVSQESYAWPVIPKGRGYVAFVKGGYDQAERNAGHNFVLSCTDCHDPHGAENYDLMRRSLNAKFDGTEFILSNTKGDWHGMWQGGNPEGLCWSCHGGYQLTKEHFQWHNQTGYCSACNAEHHPNHLAIGAFSCTGICHSTDAGYTPGPTAFSSSYHNPATFHENRKVLSSSDAKDDADYSNELVLDMRFENNLKDDHMWNLHGMWINGSGSYVPGVVGNAIEVNDNPVEVGAERNVWDSTNEGLSGNTSKITEMKYHMTLEAWVYPTSDPSDDRNRYIMTKHNYWSGGPSLRLIIKNGQYRLGLQTNMGYGGNDDTWEYDQYNCNGLRGAYSTAVILPNQWTHVGATFDWQGPNGDPNDLTVGKIRIYVNGQDVTTSDYPEWTCWAQPQDPNDPNRFDMAFMTSMGENPRCGWCGTAFSVAGINWSVPDGNFIGRLDQVKVWNITKDAAYFGSATPPVITKVEGQSGYDKLRVEFTEGAYSNTDGTGALQPSDFTFTDTDDGRTIIGVAHNAGDATATLTLSSALDVVNDLGVVTLAAASNAIYDSYGSVPADTFAVTVVALPGPYITLAESVVGSNLLYVSFSEGVYTDAGQSGPLTKDDFTCTDADNGRTITRVSHVGGDTTTILVRSTHQ